MWRSAQNCARAFPNTSDRPQNHESPCEPLRPISSRDKPHAPCGPPSATPGTAPSPHSPQHNPPLASEFSSATSHPPQKSSIAKSLNNRRNLREESHPPLRSFFNRKKESSFPALSQKTYPPPTKSAGEGLQPRRSLSAGHQEPA